MRTQCIALLVAFVATLSPVKTQAQDDDSLHVGFILANLFMERWNKEKTYFEARFNELGGKVTFIDAYDQPENQITAAKALLEIGVDALIVIPVDAVAAAPAAQTGRDAGVPVLAYDRLILNAPLDYYITFNSVTVGEEMANAVVKKISKGNILYLGGPPDDHNSISIRKGVFNVLNPLKEKYTLYSTRVDSWTELDAYLKIHDYMANTDAMPDAIICAADVLTYGAIEVLSEYGVLGEVILTGQDAELNICRHIMKGNVEMTMYKPGKQLAERTANEVWAILNGKTIKTEETINNGRYEVPSIYLDPIMVNKKTLDKTVIKDGYYTREEVYIDEK